MYMMQNYKSQTIWGLVIHKELVHSAGVLAKARLTRSLSRRGEALSSTLAVQTPSE